MNEAKPEVALHRATNWDMYSVYLTVQIRIVYRRFGSVVAREGWDGHASPLLTSAFS